MNIRHSNYDPQSYFFNWADNQYQLYIVEGQRILLCRFTSMISADGRTGASGYSLVSEFPYEDRQEDQSLEDYILKYLKLSLLR